MEYYLILLNRQYSSNIQGASKIQFAISQLISPRNNAICFLDLVSALLICPPPMICWHTLKSVRCFDVTDFKKCFFFYVSEYDI